MNSAPDAMHDLHQRLALLSPAQRNLLAQRLRDRSGSEAEAAPGDTRLVAYVTPKDAAQPAPDAAELRRFLKERLPDYMIPAAFVRLDRLPRTPNGKLDRQALPEPEPDGPEPGTAFVPPRTPTEEMLARIWAEVLGVDPVGVHDNFFEIGGDSILSIQIIAKARQAGLHLAPDQLFQHQTIAELAAVVGTADPVRAEQGAVTGPVALTPIQHWFFEQPLAEPHHWNQTLWLEAPAGVDAEALEMAVQAVVRHHDALRLRWRQAADGWQSFHAGPETSVTVSRIDLTALPEEEHAAAQEEAAATLQRSLDLAAGPLMQVAFFVRGRGRPARLLLSIHHLVVDPISWRILLEDLETAYGQLLRGEAVVLPPKTSSFKAWSEALTAYAQSDELREEASFWTALTAADAPRLPRDEEGAFTEASARTLTATLPSEETQSLLHDASAAYNTQTEDMLLTALVQSLAPWTGASALLVGLERHGREPVAPGLDLSRSVGWFTSFFPVWLNLEGASEPGPALKSVKEQLRRIPGRGLGYGLLRYLSGDTQTAKRLHALPQPEVIFNYTGRADAPLSDKGPFRSLRTLASSRSPLNRRTHLLEINAFVAGERLHLNWTYSANVHRQETVQRLAQRYVDALRALIAHCLSPGAGGYTPSDFPEAGLSQTDLDRFLDRLPS